MEKINRYKAQNGQSDNNLTGASRSSSQSSLNSVGRMSSQTSISSGHLQPIDASGDKLGTSVKNSLSPRSMESRKKMGLPPPFAKASAGPFKFKVSWYIFFKSCKVITVFF